MNHLPKYNTFKFSDWQREFAAINTNIIYGCIHKNKDILPNFYFKNYKYSKEFKRYYLLIYRTLCRELVRELMAGSTIHFPYIGYCFLGDFVTDSGIRVWNSAFKFYDDCVIKYKNNYHWCSNWKMRFKLRDYGEAGKLVVYNVLPIGELKYYNPRDNFKKRKKKKKCQEETQQQQ